VDEEARMMRRFRLAFLLVAGAAALLAADRRFGSVR
jgi:hypothetical protein